MIAVNKRASYPSGTSYSRLVFPDFLSVSAATMSKVLELAQGGVPILLLCTSVLSRTITLNDSSADVISIANNLWSMAGDGNVFAGNTAVCPRVSLAASLRKIAD